jgi:DNA end-binding protein Ku
MAARPVWRGHLRLALVSCPVALYNARHDRSAIRFNLINPDTGNRVRMVTVDGETGQELERRNLVKGYEFKKDHYLIVTQEDLDSVKVESSAVMTVEKFIDADSIDPMYYDASYFLAPDAQAGEDVYAVLREAIAQTGKVALTRVVIAQRERTVALRPMGAGLMAHTLYEERDLNNPKELFEDAARLKTDPQMVSLAIQLIERQSAQYDAADTEDRYETRLRAMLDAKLKGEGVDTEEEVPAERSNVIDLMAALKKSLGQTVDEPKETVAVKSAPALKKKKSPSPEDVRRQPGLKLAIKGGKTEAAEEAAKPPQAASKGGRKRA